MTTQDSKEPAPLGAVEIQDYFMDIGKMVLPQFKGWKTEVEDKVNVTNLVPFTYTRIEPLEYQTGIIPPKQLIFKDDYDKGVAIWELDGTLTLYPGYIIDGATGAVDTSDFMEHGAGIHDAGCTAIQRGLFDNPKNNERQNKKIRKKYRLLVDQLLYKILIEDGMPDVRAKWVFLATVGYGNIKYSI